MTYPAQPPLDDIMASIRRAVESDPPVRDPASEREEVTMPEPPHPAAPQLPLTPESTIEQLVRSLLEPQLKAWLDANLPELVERLTRAEIARLTGH